MKFIGSIACIFCLLLWAGCKNRQTEANAAPENSRISSEKKLVTEMKFPIEINPLAKYEKKPLVLEDIADIEYIPLETREDVLLSGMINGLCMSERQLVVRNREGSIFVFGRDGRLVSHFNHTGRGPGEYQSIFRFTVDFDAGEIYVYDNMLCYKVYVYSMTGDLKRSFNVPVPLWIMDFTSYDENHLLVYTNVSPDGLKTHKGAFRPYYLMSKQNGTFEQLNIEVAEMKDGKVTIRKENRSRLIGFPTSPIICNGNDIYISDFALDTLYSFQHKVLKPFIVCRPSLQNLEKSWFCGISAKTARYTFLNVIGVNEETMKFTWKCIGIDQKTGEIFEPDFQGSRFVQNIENYFYRLLPESSMVSISALELTEAYQKGELTGKLKDVASGLKEDSNPVLMLIRFKK